MDEATTRRARRSPAGNLIFGAFFLLLGGLLLAGNLGYEIPVRVWNWWPFLLIALGAARLLGLGGARRGGGLWLLAAGVYGWIGTWNLFGLTWHSAWPVFLIALGVHFVLPAERGARPLAEDDRERA